MFPYLDFYDVMDNRGTKFQYSGTGLLHRNVTPYRKSGGLGNWNYKAGAVVFWQNPKTRDSC